MWLIILSDQLPIAALVSHYLTNKLIGREPVPERLTAFFPGLNQGPYAGLTTVSGGYPPLWGW